MGDRVSIEFVDSIYEEGPVLCAHWGGEGFGEVALNFAKDMQKKMQAELKEGAISDPLHRMEAKVVIVEFISYLKNLGWGSIYLVRSTDDCDNSDNGHFRITVSQDKEILMEHLEVY